jgi:hypothetical protein
VEFEYIIVRYGSVNFADRFSEIGKLIQRMSEKGYEPCDPPIRRVRGRKHALHFRRPKNVQQPIGTQYALPL